MHFTHKNFALIFIAALIIGGAFLMAELRNKQTKKAVYTSTVAAVVDQLPSELQTVDTDNDNLRDWEELLLGTDPENADTDGDGTKDGSEASSGRNPLVKGPNDNSVQTANPPSTSNLSATDKIARDFFARYLELKQAGISNDPATQQELVLETIGKGIVLERPKAFTMNDILIKADTTILAKKAYGNEVGMIFTQNPLLGKDEAFIAKQSLEEEDPEILKQIDPIIATYKKILSGLLAISAPADVAEIHLNVVNAVNQFLFVAQSFRAVDTTPMKGLQAAREQLPAADALSAGLFNLKKYLSDAGITYTTGEPGKMFIK